MGRIAPQTAADWHDTAVVRWRALRRRMAFSIFVAAGGAFIVHAAWPAAWLASTTAAQLLSLLTTEPMRRDADFPVSRRREAAFYVSLAASAAVFAACGPLLWFSDGPGGRLLAMIVLAGGAVNVGLQARDSARQLWIACTPFMVLLLALPIISLASAAAGPDRRIMAITAVANILIVLHLAANGHRSVESARRIRETLRDAQRERRRAEAASAAKSDFLGVMSHELRTPLNGVLGMAQALAAEDLSPLQRGRVEVIRRSGESLLVLLNDLLDISQIETARLELDDGVVDLTALAAQAQAVFAPLAAARGLDFEVRLLASAGAARLGDPNRVRQVLHNLIGNAVKFTDAGRVSARIGGGPDALVFEVADTGPGIAPEQLANIFERFSPGDPSMTRRHDGCGLGLAIARGLAQRMGGEITVTSTLGEGSVFTARLALPATDTPAAEPQPPPAPLAAARGLRVLAAEDNSTNQLVLKTLLSQAGVAVQVVEDGEAAVAAWRNSGWDLVLMDIHMPRMDGLAATRAIRALEETGNRPHTPIVAVTANATAQQAAEYAAAGMDGLVPKPIQFAQLAGVINALLEPPARETAEPARRAGKAARPAA